MRYLLDTHAILWSVDKTVNKLSSRAREIISDPRNGVYISVASLWEIAIKVSLGKLDASLADILDELDKVGFTILQIENVYLRRLLDLPMIHKDPFDRLIIATTQAEGMTLLTADENIYKYDIRWEWQ